MPFHLVLFCTHKKVNPNWNEHLVCSHRGYDDLALTVTKLKGSARRSVGLGVAERKVIKMALYSVHDCSLLLLARGHFLSMGQHQHGSLAHADVSTKSDRRR